MCVCFEHHLLTGNSGDKAKGTKDTKGSEGLDVEPPRFASRLSAGVSVFGDHLQSHTEQPGDDRAERNGEQVQTNEHLHTQHVCRGAEMTVCLSTCVCGETNHSCLTAAHAVDNSEEQLPKLTQQ